MKSLTDVVSGAGLSIYAEVALVVFLLAFLGVVISLFLPSRQVMYEHLRRLPIESDATAHAAGAAGRDDRDPSFARNDTHA